MNKGIFFSIIMPSYNHGHLIGESIQSVLNQNFDNWELIIVDNNSNDNTIEVVKSFNDSRIKFHSIKNHGVIAKSRNYGISKSKGIWIAFLDSDDLFEINKLSEISKVIKDKKDGIFFHPCFNIKSNLKTNKKIGSFKLSKRNLSNLLKYGNRIVLSSVVIKKNHLEKIKFSEDKCLITVEDFDLIIKLIKNNLSLIFIDKTLGSYRVSPLSLSRNKIHFQNTINFLEKEKHTYRKKEADKIDIYISYCKIKGQIVTPIQGFKIILNHNLFSIIQLKSLLINTLNFFKSLKPILK